MPPLMKEVIEQMNEGTPCGQALAKVRTGLSISDVLAGFSPIAGAPIRPARLASLQALLCE